MRWVVPNQQVNIHFSKKRGMRIIVCCCVHKRIISTVERVEFVSVSMSYIILRVRYVI
jgi:hypothetical protein